MGGPEPHAPGGLLQAHFPHAFRGAPVLGLCPPRSLPATTPLPLVVLRSCRTFSSGLCSLLRRSPLSPSLLEQVPYCHLALLCLLHSTSLLDMLHLCLLSDSRPQGACAVGAGTSFCSFLHPHCQAGTELAEVALYLGISVLGGPVAWSVCTFPTRNIPSMEWEPGTWWVLRMRVN